MNPVHEHCSSQNFSKIKFSKMKLSKNKIFKNEILENKIFCDQNDLVCGQMVLHCFINVGT